MFGFLKKKLKEGIEKLKTSSDIEDDSKPAEQVPVPQAQPSSVDSDIAPFKPAEPKSKPAMEETKLPEAAPEAVPEKVEHNQSEEQKVEIKEGPKIEEVKANDDLQEIAKDLAVAEKQLIEKVDETEKLMIEKAREERRALEEREAAERKALEEEAAKKAAAELEAERQAESARAIEEKLAESVETATPSEAEATNEPALEVPNEKAETPTLKEIPSAEIQEETTPIEAPKEMQEAPKALSDSDYVEIKSEDQAALEEMQDMFKDSLKPLPEEEAPKPTKKKGIIGKLLRRKPKVEKIESPKIESELSPEAPKMEEQKIELTKPEPNVEPEAEIPKIEPPKIEEPKPVEEGTGLVSRIKKKVTEKKLEEEDVRGMLKDLETGLLSSDVAMEATDKIIKDLKGNLVGKSIKRGDVENVVKNSFRNSLLEIMSVPTFDLAEKVKEKKPFVIVFLGFNGVGKTTSIARVGSMLKKNGLTCLFAAADSWRAAAIEQLEEHGRNLGVEVVKHKYGADPAAVIFDAVKHATATGVDVVLADTAGRSHSNANLMDELKKIIKVNKPDLKILVLDALTGNDIYDQCKIFNDAVGVDGMILTKADVYEKGGAAISAEFTIKKPILYMGTGEGYDNFEKFEPEKIISKVLE